MATKISCDAKVHGPGEWAPCIETTTPDRVQGWVLGKRGDFCPRHARLAAGLKQRGAA